MIRPAIYFALSVIIYYNAGLNEPNAKAAETNQNVRSKPIDPTDTRIDPGTE